MINASHRNKTGRRASSWMLIGLFLLMTAPLAAQQKKDDAKEGAKQLFYNPATGAASQPASGAARGAARAATRAGQQAKKQKATSAQPAELARRPQQSLAPGIYYWIELEGVGKVTDEYVFHTGDRIKLHMRSNVDGYLSLWAYDLSGESQLIFPTPEQPENNRVLANSEYTIPGAIEFKPPAEDERLMVFFSQSPDDTPKTGRLTAEQAQQASESEGGKALLFQVEKKDKEKAGTYVVNRQGGAIAKEIRLKHRMPRQSQ